MPQFLMAGQIGDPTVALPGGAGSTLYLLSGDSYGQQVLSTGGDDSLASIKTDDVAIGKRGGRVMLRRIYTEVVWDDGNPVVRVTPTVNFSEVLEPQTFSLPNTAVTRRATLVYKAARVCTFVNVLLEVLARQGLLEFGPIEGAVVPLLGAAPLVGRTIT